jgi:hypothetical protein
MTESEILDKAQIPDEYTNKSGKTKTRYINLKAMDNNGSQFVNIHSGRGSVCINKDKVPEVIEELQGLKWKATKKAEATTTDSNNQILEAIQQVGKNQQKISKRLDKLEKENKKSKKK